MDKVSCNGNPFQEQKETGTIDNKPQVNVWMSPDFASLGCPYRMCFIHCGGQLNVYVTYLCFVM